MVFKQRIFPIFLILLFLLPVVFSACSSVEPIPGTVSTQTGSPSASATAAPSSVPSSTKAASAADDFLSQLNKTDYQNKEFRIAAYREKNFFPSDAQDIIDDVVLERNQKVEALYNVKLVKAQLSGNDFFESLRVDKSAGISACDMVVAPMDMMNLFVTYSMYTNVNTLGLDFNRPYYDKEAMEATTTGMITYAVSGSYTASPENSHCVFYNKTLHQQNGFESPLTTVKNGNWTWQTLLSQSAQATGKKATVKIPYGIGSSADEEEFIRLMWASTDVPFFLLDHPFNPDLEVDNGVANTIVRLIKNLRGSTFYYGPQQKNNKSALESFASGELLFYVSEISDFANLTNTSFRVGFAPLPKYTAEQTSYSTYSDNSFQTVYVLNNCPDLAMTAQMIEALNAASYGVIDNAYLSLYMHMYLSSNDEGLLLRDLISARYYEIGYILGDVYNQFASASTDMIYRVVTAGANFRESYKQNEKQFRRFLTNSIFDHPEPSTSAQASILPATTVAQSTAAPTSATPTATKTPTAPKPTVPASTAPIVKPTATSPAATKTVSVRPTQTKPAVTIRPTVTTIPVKTSSPASPTQTSSASLSTSPASTAAPTVSAVVSTPPVSTAPVTTKMPSTAAPTASVTAAATVSVSVQP